MLPDLFTKKFGGNKAVLSIGRVQTPTLAMLVKRQKEIDAFVQKTIGNSKPNTEKWFSLRQLTVYNRQKRAEKGLEYLKQNLFEIIAFEIKEGKEKIHDCST